MTTIPFDQTEAARIGEWLGAGALQGVPADTIVCATEADWLDARRGNIGASEVGVIMGESHWTSQYALWWRKKLDWRLPRTEAQRWGHLVEDPIAALFAEEMTGDLYVAKPLGHPYSLWASATHGWAVCTPDRLGVTPDGLVVPVELKSDEGGTGWGTPGSDEVPTHHRCQALWQAFIFGADGTYVVRKRASGKRRMVWYWVPSDPGYVADMLTRSADFLASIWLGEPPDPDGSASTTEALQDLHAVEEDTFAGVDLRLWADWVGAREDKREAIEAERLASNKLRAAMGTAQFATRKTADGLDVVFAKRRIGKRDGYTVAPGTVDELRQVGSGHSPSAPGVPGAASGSGNPPAAPAAEQEGAGVGGAPGTGVGDIDAGETGPAAPGSAALTRRRRGCDWHEEGGYGFVWTCNRCKAAALAGLSELGSDDYNPFTHADE